MRGLGFAGLLCVLAACSQPAEAPGAGAGGSASGGATANSMQPGQYRTTVTMLELSIPGVSSQSINMQPTTTEDCVATSDVNELTRGSMVDPDSGETCTQNSMSSTGGRIEGDATCTGENGARSMHISGIYTSNHVEMEINSTSDMPGGGGQMTQRMHIVTERIGECPAGDTAQ